MHHYIERNHSRVAHIDTRTRGTKTFIIIIFRVPYTTVGHGSSWELFMNTLFSDFRVKYMRVIYFF